MPKASQATLYRRLKALREDTDSDDMDSVPPNTPASEQRGPAFIHRNLQILMARMGERPTNDAHNIPHKISEH